MKTLVKRDDLLFNPFNLFDDFDRDFFSWPTKRSTIMEGDFSPACNLEESDTHFMISCDLPGMTKEDINIDLKERMLTLSGERKSKPENKGYSESYYGKFQRGFTLPENVDVENIKANFESGVLHISVPKKEKIKAKRIEIK